MPPRRSDKPLLTRYPANPILTASDWPYAANTVFNPAATRLADGTTLLLCRVENRKGHSHLTAARSRNGQDDWEVDTQPTLAPDPDNHPEERWGIEDPRITYLPELARYAVAYTAYGEDGAVVALALTEDFRRFDRLGPVTLPWDKDAALFPHRVDNQWLLIHRPTP